MTDTHDVATDAEIERYRSELEHSQDQLVRMRIRVKEDLILPLRILNRLAALEAERDALKQENAMILRDKADEFLRMNGEINALRQRIAEAEGLLRLLADTAQAAESHYECPDKPLIATIKEVSAYLAKHTPAELGEGE